MNDQGRIALGISLDVFNPNEEDFKFTLVRLDVFKGTEELIGTIEEETEFNLVKEQNSLVRSSIVLRDKNFLGSIYSFLTAGKMTLSLRGDVIYHHKVGNFKFNFNETKIIDLQEILKNIDLQKFF